MLDSTRGELMIILKTFPDDCEKEKPVLFVEKLKPHLSDAQIKSVLEVIEDICTECWDNVKRCSCFRDE